MGQGRDGVARQSMPPDLGGHQAALRSQLRPTALEDVQPGRDTAGTTLPLLAEGVHRRLEGFGARLVGHDVAALAEVERDPQVVGGDIERNGPPRVGADGGELSHEPDSRAQLPLALFEPGLETLVEIFAAAVGFHLLARHGADAGIVEVPDQRRDGAV